MIFEYQKIRKIIAWNVQTFFWKNPSGLWATTSLWLNSNIDSSWRNINKDVWTWKKNLQGQRHWIYSHIQFCWIVSHTNDFTLKLLLTKSKYKLFSQLPNSLIFIWKINHVLSLMVNLSSNLVLKTGYYYSAIQYSYHI